MKRKRRKGRTKGKKGTQNTNAILLCRQLERERERAREGERGRERGREGEPAYSFSNKHSSPTTHRCTLLA
jgi:hypothetical protein